MPAMTTSQSRRSLLAGGASLLAAAAIMPAGPAWGATPMLWDVVVVGAGLAGLNAAYLLESQGLKVQVVEAADRVGGRLRTGRNGDYRAELGGAEVGALYGRVRDACQRNGVALIETAPTPLPFTLNIAGSNIRADAWAASPLNRTEGAERNIAPFLLQNKLFFDWIPFDETGAWLDPAALRYDVSAADVMRAKGVSEAAIRLCAIDVNAPSLAQVSALSIFRDLIRAKMEGFNDPRKPQYGAGATARQSFIRDGADALPTAMARNLKTRPRLASPVVAIEQSATEVETRLADGERLRSRFIVMAAPLTAVRNILFTPDLAGPQRDAVEGATYAATTQFHFRVTRRFWEQDGLPPSIWTDAPFERAFVVRHGDDSHSMIVWLNGDGASRMDVLPLDAQRARIVALLEAMRPAIRGALDFQFAYSWEANRYIGGQKHVFAAGQVRRFARDMGKPAGRIHFAGEHLRKLEHGMESAMESSEIAAFEILDRV